MKRFIYIEKKVGSQALNQHGFPLTPAVVCFYA